MTIDILVSGDNHNLSNIVFLLCMLQCLVKVRDTAMSLLHCCCRSHFLQRQPSAVGLSYRCLIYPSVSQYLHKSCSLSLIALHHHTKTNTALFHAQWPFKLVHAASLSSGGRTTALWGNIKVPT